MLKNTWRLVAAGINHEASTRKVAKGQWEFQIFAKGRESRG